MVKLTNLSHFSTGGATAPQRACKYRAAISTNKTMEETSAEGITTVELSGKQLHSYRDGAQVYVLYSKLLQQFQLGNSISPSTLQRRKNKIVSANQFCPSKPLQQLQEAGVVRKEARKVAVLTVQEAVKLLQLYNITAIAEDESDAEMPPPLGVESHTLST